REVVFGESPPVGDMTERRFVARSLTAMCMLSEGGKGDACFDVAQDPDELQPHDPEDSKAFARLHRLARDYRDQSIVAQRRFAQPRRGHASVVTGAASPAAASADPAPAPAIERKLKALGYTQ